MSDRNYFYTSEIGVNDSIGASAFQNCYSLTSMSIPNSVTSIGADMFTYCHIIYMKKFYRAQLRKRFISNMNIMGYGW